MKLPELSCRRRVALIIDSLDRELPADQIKTLRNHQLTCRSCRKLLASLKRTVLTLKKVKKNSSPPTSSRLRLRQTIRNVNPF
jgi:hypothetical protein